MRNWGRFLILLLTVIGYSLELLGSSEAAQNHSNGLGASATLVALPQAGPPTMQADTKTSSQVKQKKKRKLVKLPTLSDPNELYFSVTEFQVEGNSLLTKKQISEVLDEFKGFAQQFGDLDQARRALETVYHKAGYPFVLVTLPPQSVETGIVKLEVVEARLNKVTGTGNRFFSTQSIRKKLPSLKEGTVPYAPTVEKEIYEVNAHPDRNVTPIIKKGTEPGTVDLELKVNDRLPLHFSATGDNQGSLNTPRNRLTMEGQYTNVFDFEHILTFQTVQTPEDWGEIEVYGLTYVAPLGKPGHLFSLFGSIADTNSVLAGTGLPITGAGDIGVVGNSKSAGFRYNFPLYSEGLLSHQASIGLDYIRLEETSANFPGGLGTAVVTSPIEYTPLSISYTGILPHFQGITTISTTLKGYVAGTISGGEKEDFAGDPNDPINKPGNRQGSTGTFGILQGSIDRTQPLPFGYSLFAHLDGQWANEPLIAGEQLFAGGMTTVRGYIQNESLGDMGFRTRIEFHSPSQEFNFDRPYNSWLNAKLNLLAFYDGAFLWIRRSQPGQDRQFDLEGVGIGLRGAFLEEYISLQLDSGWALQDSSVTRKGDNFTHFLVKLKV